MATSFRIITVEELKPVLDVLNGLSWPVASDEFPETFGRLGWEKQRRRGGMTTLPVSPQIGSVGEVDGEISRIEFRVKDTLPGTNHVNLCERHPARATAEKEPQAPAWGSFV